MKVKQNSNGKRLIFSESTFKRIGDILTELVKRSRANLCIFADMDGFPISHGGSVDNVDISIICALAAGTFSATAAMAKESSGEKKFRFIYQEGERRNAYLCNVFDDYLMIVLFDKGVTLGLIRILTNQAISRLQELFDELKDEKSQVTQFLDVEFRTLLGKELDKTFGLK
jgi:predicted regulator of Ras-like GTPase activity (Roadblock/LC7/MglB family)